jgi:hypothetical protein
MSRHRSTWIAGLALTLGLVAGSAEAAKELGPFKITLRYMPQESVGTSTPTLAMGISDRPIQLSIVDGRTVTDPVAIGESTDDDDRVWPVHAANDLLGWTNEVLNKNAADWGVRLAPDAPLALSGHLLRFDLTESNKPVGSMYTADVRVAFQLKNDRGQVLWEGTGAGDATRFGKSRSQENASEVLSDAIKTAYATVFAARAAPLRLRLPPPHPRLRASLRTSSSPSSPSSRSRDLPRTCSSTTSIRRICRAP